VIKTNDKTIPTMFKDEVFTQAFEKAELANYGQEELEKYEMNLKIYRDDKNTVDTAFDKGKLEGMLEGKLEVAKTLKESEVPIELIIRVTGLLKEHVDR